MNNTLRPRRNDQHFADDIFKRIFFNENVWISLIISLKFVPMSPTNNIPSLVQIMAWRRSGDKPLSEPMLVSLPTHICVTRPQWDNIFRLILNINLPGEFSLLYPAPPEMPDVIYWNFYVVLKCYIEKWIDISELYKHTWYSVVRYICKTILFHGAYL